MNELLQLKREVDRAQAEVEKAQAELKDAKAWKEACVKQVMDWIEFNEQPNLFNQPAPGESVDNGQAAERVEIIPDDSWKAERLEWALPGLSLTLIERLIDAELRTVGDLANFTATKRLIDIKGIGAAKAEQIEKALENFWNRRQSKVPTAPPEEPAPSPPEEPVPTTEEL